MSTALIKSLTASRMVVLFNELAPTTEGYKVVNKFADRETAERRLAAILAAAGRRLVEKDGETVIEPPVDAEKAKDAAAVPPVAGAKERKKRGFRFVFPKKDEIKTIRPNTKRSVAIELLGRPKTDEHPGGATFQEVRDATGWNEKDAYEGIRLIHFWVGYGMRQDDAGRIFLVK